MCLSDTFYHVETCRKRRSRYLWASSKRHTHWASAVQSRPLCFYFCLSLWIPIFDSLLIPLKRPSIHKRRKVQSETAVRIFRDKGRKNHYIPLLPPEFSSLAALCEGFNNINNQCQRESVMSARERKWLNKIRRVK